MTSDTEADKHRAFRTKQTLYMYVVIFERCLGVIDVVSECINDFVFAFQRFIYPSHEIRVDFLGKATEAAREKLSPSFYSACGNFVCPMV